MVAESSVSSTSAFVVEALLIVAAVVKISAPPSSSVVGPSLDDKSVTAASVVDYSVMGDSSRCICFSTLILLLEVSVVGDSVEDISLSSSTVSIILVTEPPVSSFYQW